MDKTTKVFGNNISRSIIKSAVRQKNKFIKKFGDDRNTVYHLKLEENQTLGEPLGIKNVVISKEKESIESKGAVIVGNIRMGYGHYRISMAIASAAHALGYTPYWLDLNSFKETTGGKIINYQNELYSLGSRMSQKSSIFNKFIWEPINYEGFKKITYNAKDQKVAELMTPIFKEIPKDIPYIATHAWPAQAAVHAGMKTVVNVIPDNWPMALHLSEGAIHTVQTPSAYFGYRTLNGMNKNKILNPMGHNDIVYTGHYIDHELVSNIELDCKKRIERIKNNKPLRVLLTIGGAGAQCEIFIAVIKFLLPYIKQNKVAIYINVGDYRKVWEEICSAIPSINDECNLYFDNWDKIKNFAEQSIEEDVRGIHAFSSMDIFQAVYTTNLLMRSCDILITKPSELSFYPVPKLLIKRIGGHERWGAVRASEVGDGTVECRDINHILQMLKIMIHDNTIIEFMSNNILKAKKAGVYDGAYEAVKLAVKNS